MKNHLNYLKYVLRHKWFVGKACLKLGVPIHRAILHDWSKFLPSEWKPYVETFYAKDGRKQYEPSDDFNYAWNYHQKRHPHHYQYWMLTMDRGETILLEIPETYVREMVADWVGAGQAIHGKIEVSGWYNKNKENIHLNPKTRVLVEELIQEVERSK